MKSSLRILSIFVLAFVITTSAVAQDQKNNFEIFGGYSYLNQNLDELEETIKQQGMHGFNASFTGNVHKWIGFKFDFSTHGKTDSFVNEPLGIEKLRFRTTQYLGGVQIKNNLKDGPTVKPFGHVLAGVANQKLSGIGTSGSVSFTEGENNFSMVFGGGLDVKVHPRVDIRVFQFDYNPIFTGDNTIFGTESFTQNNWRLSFGVVFH